MTDFHFEQNDQYKVQVYDSDDDKAKNLDAHDFIGELEFTLHDVVTQRDQTLRKKLFNASRSNPGEISISAEEREATSNSEIVMFNPVWETKNTSGFNFFLIYREVGPNKFVPVYKSEVKRAQ